MRAFSPSDAEALYQLIVKTIDVSYSQDYPPSAISFFKRFHAPHEILERAKAGTVLVVEENGTLMATGSLLDGEIFGVFVHPDRQGRGLGGQVMHALEEKARAAGISEAWLSVSLPSRVFYEGLGYEIVEARSRLMEDGASLEFWKAKKKLTE